MRRKGLSDWRESLGWLVVSGGAKRLKLFSFWFEKVRLEETEGFSANSSDFLVPWLKKYRNLGWCPQFSSTYRQHQTAKRIRTEIEVAREDFSSSLREKCFFPGPATFPQFRLNGRR